MFVEEIVCENYFELWSALYELDDCSEASDVTVVQEGSILNELVVLLVGKWLGSSFIVSGTKIFSWLWVFCWELEVECLGRGFATSYLSFWLVPLA